MSTIEYAMMRDFEQQLDYEQMLYGGETLEDKELKEFKLRCRQSKVSATKILKYDRELRNTTDAIKKQIGDIQYKMRHTKGVKTLELLKKQLAKKYEELERTEHAIYEKYFKKKK